MPPLSTSELSYPNALHTWLAGLDNICTALPVAKNLSYLDISSCNIRLLSGLTLVVADAFHGIQDKAMLQEEFHGAIPDCAAHLQVLKLRDNGLDDEELQGLGEALQENSLLGDLDLAGNQVGSICNCRLMLCGMSQVVLNCSTTRAASWSPDDLNVVYVVCVLFKALLLACHIKIHSKWSNMLLSEANCMYLCK